MIIVISNVQPPFIANIPSAQFYRYFNCKFIVKFMLSMVTLLMWLYFLSTLIRVVRFSKSFYAKKVVPNDVMSSIALDVTLSFHRGVYCSMVMHPKALFWKKSFLEIEDQNLLSGARSVLTFGRRSYQILVRDFST